MIGSDKIKKFNKTMKTFMNICHLNKHILNKFWLLQNYYRIIIDIINYSLPMFKDKLEGVCIQAFSSYCKSLY